MPQAYLGLGSNLGDSAATLRAAFSELSIFFEGPRLSRLWRTKALYFEAQPDFVNAAMSGETRLSPRELLAAVNEVEARFGRDRSRELPKGPRSLDVDILLYGSLLLDEHDLVIPHPGLRERLFALLPILDLDPGLRDPRGGEPFSRIASALSAQGIYLLG
jgi:2-amino-4-hydroxy-6-hydroxymethyldihydropteridine diphosphokinase